MSGMIISTPTMSMNAVIISTVSLPTSVLRLAAALGNAGGFDSVIRLFGDLAQRCRRDRAADDAGERDDGERVRDHLDELRGDRLRALQLNLQRLRRREQQAC